MTLHDPAQGGDAAQVQDAAQVLEAAHAALPHAEAYRALPAPARTDLTGQLDRVRAALAAGPLAFAAPADPYANQMLEPAPARALSTGPFGNLAARGPVGAGTGPDGGNGTGGPATGDRASLLRAVNDLPAATGAMMDELGFADFVASLVHGTFDAIVDSSIRQMEAFAKLVSSLAQTVEDFSRENVTPNQVRDWLVERHPRDLALILPQSQAEQPRLVPRGGDDTWGARPTWLADYGFAGETLTEEFIETQLVPAARNGLGQERMRTLASMAILGMQRVAVERGEISARIRIRAKAADQARVDFAQSQDPAAQQSSWGARSGFAASAAQAMVSTSVNAQSDAAIAAELQGEVKITFRSEALPLENFVSDAQRVLLERAARRPAEQTTLAAPPASGATPVTDALAPQPEPQPASQPVAAPAAPPAPQPDTGGGAT